MNTTSNIKRLLHALGAPSHFLREYGYAATVVDRNPRTRRVVFVGDGYDHCHGSEDPSSEVSTVCTRLCIGPSYLTHIYLPKGEWNFFYISCNVDEQFSKIAIVVNLALILKSEENFLTKQICK